jgi:hypothetical protein
MAWPDDREQPFRPGHNVNQVRFNNKSCIEKDSRHYRAFALNRRQFTLGVGSKN